MFVVSHASGVIGLITRKDLLTEKSGDSPTMELQFASARRGLLKHVFKRTDFLKRIQLLNGLQV
jgi:hypothetical protein